MFEHGVYIPNLCMAFLGWKRGAFPCKHQILRSPIFRQTCLSMKAACRLIHPIYSLVPAVLGATLTNIHPTTNTLDIAYSYYCTIYTYTYLSNWWSIHMPSWWYIYIYFIPIIYIYIIHILNTHICLITDEFICHDDDDDDDDDDDNI